MIYIHTALLPEAKPFIVRYKLAHIAQTPFDIYADERLTLIIGGMGRDRALMAVTHLFTRFAPTSSDVFLNIGMAGSHHPVGSVLLAHTLTNTTHAIYPDMRLSHPLIEAAVTTVDAPVDGECPYEAVDMEAYYAAQAALFFVKTSQLLCIKVVSDNFNATVPSKEAVFSWINEALEPAMALAQALQAHAPQSLSFSPALQNEVEKLKAALFLTKAQSDQLFDALKGYLLRRHQEPLLPKYLPTTHKKEQKDAFAKLLTLLNA